MGSTVDYCLCCGSRDLLDNPAIWMPFIADRAMGLPPMEITDAMQLRTIKKGTAYALCKSLFCKGCGHLFVNYRFDDDEMRRLYKDYRGKEYCSLRAQYEPGYASQNAALSHGMPYRPSVEAFLYSLLPPCKLNILDWGGDTGRNTPFVDKASIVHIYEPSGIKPEFHNAVNVSNAGDFLPHYELVVLSNVLEHMPWPEHTVKAVVDYMSTTSVLFVEVPFEAIQCEAAADGPRRRSLLKLHWHEHINFFSKESLAKLLDTCNLQVLSWQALEIDRGATGVSSPKVLQFACKKK